MEKYLIAVDLDGTLLTDNKTISLYTKQTLQKAIAHGHYVVISTGRPFRLSIDYYNELELDTPIVNINGAYVHHPKDSTWGEYHRTLSIEDAKKIIKTCEAYDLANILIEAKDDVYIKNPDPEITKIIGTDHPKIIKGDLSESLRFGPTCILVQPFKENVSSLVSDLGSQYADAVYQRSWGEPWYIIEMIKRGVNKANGLKKVADSLEIPSDRIIAFGDEDNDLEMLAYAGRGIAMGNASDEVKQIANEITDTNEKDGIAKYIEKALSIS
ncbi:Cof-type HAD-IIB family hydrolase [Scopulibacillus cellulosilyticus]|uniref:Cof-type HAD-IIB family hydrolase n=1 Tax=Scopulibacillus cellulosilyticus TaxID=2665665 RepID=A0ABW2PVE3_9BACL